MAYILKITIRKGEDLTNKVELFKSVSDALLTLKKVRDLYLSKRPISKDSSREIVLDNKGWFKVVDGYSIDDFELEVFSKDINECYVDAEKFAGLI